MNAGQRGVVTLTMSLIVLVLITLVVVAGSRTTLLEKKLTNNDNRSRQAFEAAEAGLAAAVDYLAGGRDRDGDGVLDGNVFDTTLDGIGDSDTADVGTGRVIVTPTDLSGGALATIQVVAQGFSDDSSATRTVSRIFQGLNPLPNMPDNPLTTRRATEVNGSATVINPEGRTTIWSGGDIDLGSNNSTHTEVPDATDPNYPSCMDTSRTCTTVSSSNKVTEGLDVIEQDANLGSLSSDDFFANYFGTSPEAYRSSLVTMETTPANANADVQLAVNEVIWIEGDVTFENNTTVGCSIVVTGSNVCPGANTRPSLVIVNGDATFNGTPHFYGVVFVIGNIGIKGNTTVYGALLAGGEFGNETGGSLDLTYDSSLLGAIQNSGPLGTVAGSWRDF